MSTSASCVELTYCRCSTACSARIWSRKAAACFEAQSGRGGFHLPGQALDHLRMPATQEQLGQAHVGGVVRLRDQSHAGRLATLDLVHQAGPRAMREHRFLAGAQQKCLLDQLDALAHRQPVGERAEVARFLLESAAMVEQARKLAAPRQANVGIGLVVAKQDVVLRRQFLDQGVFEDQRLRFGARRGNFHGRHLLQHQRDARAVAGLVEVGRDALLQVLRLADVEHGTVRIEHAIDARRLGQACQKLARIEGRGACRVRTAASPAGIRRRRVRHGSCGRHSESRRW